MIVTFGDLHLNKNPIRILEAINFLDYIQKYCLKNNIKTIVNLGDTFDQANSIKNECFVPIFMKFMEIAKSGIQIYTLIGNHDTMDNNNDSLVETFSAFSTVIKKSATYNIDGIDYDFLSYTKDPDDIPNSSNANVLFGHLEVEGFWFNPTKKIDTSIFEQSKFSNYNCVVSGHLHHNQNEGKFHFIGTPYEKDKGEAGKANYFGLIDKDTIELISYEEAPKYVEVSAETALESGIDFTNKMVTVLIDKKVENYVKLRNILLTQKGAISVEPLFIKSQVEEVEEKEISMEQGVMVSMAKYIDNVKPKDTTINKELLINCYKEVLKRVKES